MSAEGRRPRRRRWGLVLVVVLLALCSGTGYVYAKLNGNISSQNVDDALGADRPAGDDSPGQPENILLLGSDTRAGADAAYGQDTGQRSDSAMVLHLSADRSRATVVSVPRDTMVRIPVCPSGNARPATAMYNSALSTGGLACAVKTTESLTGLRMNHVVEIDFVGFQQVVDALGGVDITLDKPIKDEFSDLDLPAGTSHLDGKAALALVRTRHGVGDGSDLGRILLQHQFLSALAGKVGSENLLTSPAELYQVADAATRAITTDSKLAGLGPLLSFAKDLSGLKPENIEFLTMPNSPYPADRNRLIPREPAASALWSDLRADRVPPPQNAS